MVWRKPRRISPRSLRARTLAVNTSQHEAKSEEVDHWTPYSHWCARCWHWLWTASTFLIRFRSNTIQSMMDGSRALPTIAGSSAWKFDSNGTPCINTVRCRCKSFAKSGKRVR